VTQAANAQVPGVCGMQRVGKEGRGEGSSLIIIVDQTKLSILTTSSIKCAASSRVVAYRPNIHSALQQLVSSLTEISVPLLLLFSLLFSLYPPQSYPILYLTLSPALTLTGVVRMRGLRADRSGVEILTEIFVNLGGDVPAIVESANLQIGTFAEIWRVFTDCAGYK
jgi:hypothetical protein